MKYFTLIVVLSLFYGCAKVGRPSGGAKDIAPPVIINAKPDFNSINFDSDEIVVYFDEYIKLKDIQKQLVVSPPLEYPLDISPMGTASKKIKISFKDTLKANTTYSINFGNAIQDNSEGNALEQFQYVFSTGSHLDSLSISGQVKHAFIEKQPDHISVMLYAVDSAYHDSIPFKQKPNYVANTLEGSAFSITNIKEGTYELVALQDKNGNLIFDPKEDAIGFLNQRITIPTDSIYELKIAKEEPRFSIKKISELSQNHILLAYEGGDKPSVASLHDKFKNSIDFHSYKENLTDTLHLWHKKIDSDTLIIAVKEREQIDLKHFRLRSQVVDSLRLKKSSTSTLHLNDTLFISSNLPIKSYDLSNIHLFRQDSIKVPFEIEVAKNKTKMSILFEKTYKEQYKINLNPNAIFVDFGTQKDTINYTFSIRSPEDYGEIVLDIETAASSSLIVELLTIKGVIVKRKICKKSQKINFPMLVPEKYTVRIIVDKNQNNKWDSGSFITKEQPESVLYLGKEIDLRANWSVEEKFKI